MGLKDRVKELEDDLMTLKDRLVQMEYNQKVSKTENENYMFETLNQLIWQLSKVSTENHKLVKKNEDLEEVIEMICNKSGIVILRK